VPDFLIRGFLAGALLGFATTLALTATKQTSLPIVGAVIFPVGFVLIVLLGLELVTGNFALLPVACQAKRIIAGELFSNGLLAGASTRIKLLGSDRLSLKSKER
jgi:formate/nitrite transporter FocA (FNT family)